MKLYAALAIVLCAAPALAADPPATLSTSEPFPVAGKATSIATPPEADTIAVTYSPSSEVVATETLEVKKLTPPQPGKPYLTVWVPQRAGVVELTAGGEKTRVSIRFDGVPTSGVAIMIVAALILFGGAFLSMRSILTRDG